MYVVPGHSMMDVDLSSHDWDEVLNKSKTFQCTCSLENRMPWYTVSEYIVSIVEDQFIWLTHHIYGFVQACWSLVLWGLVPLLMLVKLHGGQSACGTSLLGSMLLVTLIKQLPSWKTQHHRLNSWLSLTFTCSLPSTPLGVHVSKVSLQGFSSWFWVMPSLFYWSGSCIVVVSKN